ncbi:MAG TPA: hypothetical protein VNM47_12220 [Terriglobia bacterium]|nr:hypothetical protein [Terriglobia bacterium]
MSRKAWMIFLVVQGAGIILSWLANYTSSPSPLISGVGVGLLVLGNLLLLPGGLLGALAVQRLLLHSGFNMSQLSFVGVVVAVAINLGIWLLCAKLHRSV